MNLTPQQIVTALDTHIIGQKDAKRAVAIALRNRWRRMQLDEELRNEIVPKNILMIGPTGVGKTEIARRLARLADAPFIKVEATKFTEVGYVGRDVESIIRDLADNAWTMCRDEARELVRQQAEEIAQERIIDRYVPKAREDSKEPSGARKVFLKKLLDGELDDDDIEIEVQAPSTHIEFMGPPGLEEMTNQLQGMFSSLNKNKSRKRKMKVRDARKVLVEEAMDNLLNEEEIRQRALALTQQNGIVFIDEIDKIAAEETRRNTGPSREGVQRDLLPIIEGTQVKCKYGMVHTDHILFIASGAFHLSKPADLIPELQGRLPIRVELQALTPEDFSRILTEPQASLTAQYEALMGTEGLKIKFTSEAIQRIAELAWQVNDRIENIGARRLHTIMEKLIDEISFDAANLGKKQRKKSVMKIDVAYVDKQLNELVKDQDLSRYIL